MNVILGILMVAIVGLYVAAPFFRRDADEETPLPEPVAPKDVLERQKREAYAAIKEAEFDREMGKLSDADFTALTDKYRQQALGAIAGLDTATPRPAARGPGLPTRLAFCATCGRQLPEKANFCPSCGRGIQADRESLQSESSENLSGATAQTA